MYPTDGLNIELANGVVRLTLSPTWVRRALAYWPCSRLRHHVEDHGEPLWIELDPDGNLIDLEPAVEDAEAGEWNTLIERALDRAAREALRHRRMARLR